MTVSSSISKAGPYACNGATTAFAFAFYTQATADIAVVRTDAVGTDTALTLGADYSVALNADQTTSPGGSVTLAVAPASGLQITILRSLALTQGASLPNQGGWYPKVVENALDKLTMAMQQIAEKVNRAVVLGVTQTDASVLINSITANAAAAAADAATASAAALAANQSFPWVSGTVYTQGEIRYSPIDGFSYRKLVTGGGTADPSIDAISGSPTWTPANPTKQNYMNVSERQASGVQGGSTVAADITQTRGLNTVETNNIGGASLSGNSVVLPAGTYRYRFRAPAFMVNTHKALLYNATDATYTGIGSSEYANSGSSVQTSSVGAGLFTISATKSFTLRHYTQNLRASTGLGISTGAGQPEVYSELELWKVG